MKRGEFHWSWLNVDRLQEQTDCNWSENLQKDSFTSGRLKRDGNINVPEKRIEKKLRRRFLDITLLMRAQACGHTIKKAEHRRTGAFELWCWRVPWTARRANLKEINPEYSLEGLMLKLKFQSFGHLMQITDLLEKTMMLGKIEGRRRRG